MHLSSFSGGVAQAQNPRLLSDSPLEGLWLSPERLSPGAPTCPLCSPVPAPRSILDRTARAILLTPNTMQSSAENAVMLTAFTQS